MRMNLYRPKKVRTFFHDLWDFLCDPEFWVPVVFCIALLTLLIGGAVILFNEEDQPPRDPGSVEEAFTFRGEINKICLEGHSYYMWASHSRGGIAPVLNDDGTPGKCAVEKSE